MTVFRNKSTRSFGLHCIVKSRNLVDINNDQNLRLKIFVTNLRNLVPKYDQSNTPLNIPSVTDEKRKNKRN